MWMCGWGYRACKMQRIHKGQWYSQIGRRLIEPDRRSERSQKLIWPDRQWRSDFICSSKLISQIGDLEKNPDNWYSQIGPIFNFFGSKTSQWWALTYVYVYSLFHINVFVNHCIKWICPVWGFSQIADLTIIIVISNTKVSSRSRRRKHRIFIPLLLSVATSRAVQFELFTSTLSNTRTIEFEYWDNTVAINYRVVQNKRIPHVLCLLWMPRMFTAEREHGLLCILAT